MASTRRLLPTTTVVDLVCKSVRLLVDDDTDKSHSPTDRFSEDAGP